MRVCVCTKDDGKTFQPMVSASAAFCQENLSFETVSVKNPLLPHFCNQGRRLPIRLRTCIRREKAHQSWCRRPRLLLIFLSATRYSRKTLSGPSACSDYCSRLQRMDRHRTKVEKQQTRCHLTLLLCTCLTAWEVAITWWSVINYARAEVLLARVGGFQTLTYDTSSSSST